MLACEELYQSLYDARLWMSLGNTTSSAHFDTHENLLLQVDGRKEVLLWHPNETANLYMDHHAKVCDRRVSPCIFTTSRTHLSQLA